MRPRRSARLQVLALAAVVAATYVHLSIGESENYDGSILRPIGHGTILVMYAWLIVIIVSCVAILGDFRLRNLGWIGLSFAVAGFWLMFSI